MSYTESKIMARAGAFASPTGAGTSNTTKSSNSLTPCPVLALTLNTSLGLHPTMFANSAAYLSGCAAGKSILFNTGIIVMLFSKAK